MGDGRSLGSLSDECLLRQFGRLVRMDTEQAAELLRYVAEIDARELWAKYGHPSMFDFCVVRFHMSESTAGKRIGAARAARRFPVLFDMVARADIHLSGIVRLKPYLTSDNHQRVLAEATHKTMKELDHLIARLAPRPDVPSRVQILPRRGTAASPSSEPTLFTPESSRPTSTAEPPPLPPPRAPDPTPLAPRRYKLVVTMSEETNHTLERLQGLLSHQIPDGDPAAIVARGLDLLLSQTLKKKAAITDNPRASVPQSSGRSRSIPAHVRREVHERDGGRCAFVGADGRRCNETRGVELAHLHPWAKGGEHSVDNVSLRCRAHNVYEANRDYGPLFMARKLEEARSTREELAVYATTVHVDCAA